MADGLPSGLDFNRGVKGVAVSNSLLEFKQSSFTHTSKSWGASL